MDRLMGVWRNTLFKEQKATATRERTLKVNLGCHQRYQLYKCDITFVFFVFCFALTECKVLSARLSSLLSGLAAALHNTPRSGWFAYLIALLCFAIAVS